MKKINIILAVCILLSGFAVQAQNSIFTVALSKKIKGDCKRSFSVDMVADGNGGIIECRACRNAFLKIKYYYLIHYNSSMQVTKRIEMEDEDNNLLKLYVKEDKLYIFELKVNDPNKTFDVNLLVTDMHSFDFERQHLYSIDQEDFETVYIFNADELDVTEMVTISDNEKYIVLNIDIKNSDNATHRIVVFDQNFTKIYEQQLQKDKKDADYRLTSMYINENTGEVYLLAKVDKGHNKDEVDFNYELSKINNHEVTSKIFETGERFVYTLGIMNTENGLQCAGFFGEGNANNIKGVVYYNLSRESLAIQSEKYTNFPETFYLQKYGDKKGKRKNEKDKGLYNLSIDKIYLLDDGSMIINAEEFYTTTRYSAATGNSNTYYHFDDIISCCINSDGSIKWMKNINKQTVASGNAKYLSYSSIVINGNVYFLMNAPIEIDKKRDGRLIIEQPDAAFYAFKIDATGNLSYTKLIREDNLEVTMFPRHANFLKKYNTIIIRGGKGKEYQLAKITY